MRSEGVAIRDAWAAGSQRWAGVALRLDDFERYVRQERNGMALLRPDGTVPHAADVFLAVASLSGAATALTYLDQEFLARVPQFVSNVDGDAAFASDVRQILWERLVCPPSERLRDYRATGPLLAWIRVCATRVAVDLKRSGRTDRASYTTLVDNLVDPARGQEWHIARDRYGAIFDNALRDAVSRLEPRLRSVLRMHFISASGIDAIARVYGVHRATAARWISAGEQAIRRELTAALKSSLRLSASECASLVSDIRSAVQFSLNSLF